MCETICSLNVRGLNNSNKRESLFKWFDEKNYTVCLLQETHTSELTKTQWKSEWNETSFFSGTKSNSEGLGILIKNRDNVSIGDFKELIPGRLFTIDITINNQELTLINVYGPNNDDTSFFEQLELHLLQNLDKNYIIGGDFNTILNPQLDKKNGKQDTHTKCRNTINNIINSCNLIDIWRASHPEQTRYTWHSNGKPAIFCRLDYFLISENLCNIINRAKIKPGSNQIIHS